MTDCCAEISFRGAARVATKRRLNGGILANIVKYTEDTEIPARFALWAGMSAISACLKRDCFIDQGYFVVYPNTYIVLVAGSAMCKKSTAIMMANDFITQVQPPVRLLSQKVTCEALIGSLAGGGTADSSIVALQPAVGIAIVDELFTLINKNSFKDGLIPVLTKLYDCQEFPYETRSHGVEKVRNPCLCILGGSTSEWIREAVPVAAIGGGFTSRIVFVYQNRGEKRVPWPTLSEENRERRRSIINDLCAVSEMRGAFAISEGARTVYDSEYVRFCDHSTLLDEPNLHGYCGRRGHILLKVAMAVSASRCSDRIIEQCDIEAARLLLEEVEGDMPRVLKSITSKEVGDIFEQIIAYMARHKVVTRTELVNKFRSQMTSDDLSVLVRTLEEAGSIKIAVSGPKITYYYVENVK
jgi:hypothetical protein